MNLTLRRDTIVTVLALLVLAIALPFAIVETFETGRVYLFSRQFIEELPQRFTGPGRLRFILQPMTAILLGIRGGLRESKSGNPPNLFGLLFGAERRRELLRSGVAAIRNLVALGIIMDIVFQLIIYGSAHPGAAVVIGPILICFPYALSRQVAGNERHHFRIAAAVLSQIENDRIYIAEEIHRRRCGEAANFRIGKHIEFHVANVPGKNLYLIEATIHVFHLLAILGNRVSIRGAPPVVPALLPD
jgi:hypothetical protein